MKIIVGLGNPGGEYKDTRHNVGFMVVEKLAKELGPTPSRWEESTSFQSSVSKTPGALLVKPVVFMNNSGLAVSKIVRFYKLTPQDVWVIHDDIDLPLGKLRIRRGGGSGGHNGVESIIKELKSDAFVRFRMGIGRGKLFERPTKGFDPDEMPDRQEKRVHTDKRLYHQSVVDFVLSRFTQGEAGALKHLIKTGTEAVQAANSGSVDQAMTLYNH